jgi:hypothetical protein
MVPKQQPTLEMNADHRDTVIYYEKQDRDGSMLCKSLASTALSETTLTESLLDQVLNTVCESCSCKSADKKTESSEGLMGHLGS